MKNKKLTDCSTDEELIDLINGGDYDAFETLYYRYRDWVYDLAWRCTRRDDLAMDVGQETFIYLLSKFPGFELTAAMKTFLYPVVKHTAINFCRLSRRFTSSDEILDQMVAPPAVESGDGREGLAEVIGGLGAESREIVLMRFVDEMSLGEIAEALDIELSTVKSRLYRAMETLRNDPKTRDYFNK